LKRKLERNTEKKENKEKIIYILIEKEMNNTLLKEAAYDEVEGTDLVKLYKLMLVNDSKTVSMATITKSLLKNWGVTKEEITTLANENTPQHFPANIKSMHEQFPVIPDESMIIVTNDKMTCGAGVILYPGVLEGLSKKFGGDFIIIPSSIHEVLAVPYNTEYKNFALASVKETNETKLSMDEILSDHPYAYVGGVLKLL